MKHVIRSLERHDNLAPALFAGMRDGIPTFTRDAAEALGFRGAAEARAFALAQLFAFEAGVFDVVTA